MLYLQVARSIIQVSYQVGSVCHMYTMYTVYIYTHDIPMISGITNQDVENQVCWSTLWSDLDGHMAGWSRISQKSFLITYLWFIYIYTYIWIIYGQSMDNLYITGWWLSLLP